MYLQYICNILFLKFYVGHTNAHERIKGRKKKKEKQKISLRLTGYWISMSRPGEVSKTSSVGSD